MVTIYELVTLIAFKF